MDKDKKSMVSKLIYDYVDSLSIPDVQIDIIGEGEHTLSVALTVPEGYKDDVDEMAIYDLIGSKEKLNDVEVNFACYTYDELKGELDGAEDEEEEVPMEEPWDGTPEEEAEVREEHLTVRSHPDYDDPVYLEEEEEEDGEYRKYQEDDDDPADYEEEEEIEGIDDYKPDWDDLKDLGFFGDDDDR